MDNYHKPVLLNETIGTLGISINRWYLDATLGDGGHSLAILRLGGNVVGIDVDPKSLEVARTRFTSFSQDRYRLIQGNFREVKKLVQTNMPGIKFSGALFDLGISSRQLSDQNRGFSFQAAGQLDMRMDPALQVKAIDLINGLNKGELYELFTKLGEEKFAKRIATALVLTREIRPKMTTVELASVVDNVYKQAGFKNFRIHPATKVFQALRLAINDELNSLKEALPQIPSLMVYGGKIVVISFHSLEDRIVKHVFIDWQASGIGKIVKQNLRDFIPPTDGEIRNNPRSRSAKLRSFEFI